MYLQKFIYQGYALLCCLTFCFGSERTSAQHFSFDWVSLGDTLAQSSNSGICEDSSGYIYAAESVAYAGSLIHKYDSSGNIIWSVPNSAWIKSIACDSIGNIYVSGLYGGSLELVLGIDTISSLGSNDVFLMKYDSSGVYQWGRYWGSPNGEDIADLEVDQQGNVIVMGCFTGTMDFDPGTGINNLTSLTEYDIFILKLDPTGSLTWAVRSGGRATWSNTAEMEIDSESNVILSGSFISLEDFGQTSPNIITAVGADLFIQKFDSNGVQLWVKIITGNQTQIPSDVEIDGLDQIYLAGQYRDTTDFDLGPNVYNLFPIGAINGPATVNSFILKMNPDGNFIWARNIGGEFAHVGIRELECSASSDYVYVIGRRFGISQLDFDEDIGVTVPPSGGDEHFLIALDSNSNHYWTKFFETSNVCNVLEIHYSLDHSMYVAGSYKSMDFDPGPQVESHSVLPPQNHFLLRMNSCPPIYSTTFGTVCDSYYSSDSSLYYDQTGNYTMIIAGDSCDSSVALNLIVNDSYSVVDSVFSCDEYTWIDGNTYTSSMNTATHLLFTETGCDSLITLALTIVESNSTIESISVYCDSYTWIDGNTYYASNNTATYTLLNSAGCDSTVTLDLTLNSINTTIQLIGDTLSALQDNATYQWINCADNEPINGATDQFFIPDFGGAYACMITYNSCTDTTSCMVSTVGLIESPMNNSFSVYPNPTSDNVTVYFHEDLSTVNYTLCDLSGRVISSGKSDKTDSLNVQIVGERGVYFLNLITTNNKRYTFPIVKQ